MVGQLGYLEAGCGELGGSLDVGGPRKRCLNSRKHGRDTLCVLVVA